MAFIKSLVCELRRRRVTNYTRPNESDWRGYAALEIDLVNPTPFLSKTRGYSDISFESFLNNQEMRGTGEYRMALEKKGMYLFSVRRWKDFGEDSPMLIVRAELSCIEIKAYVTGADVTALPDPIAVIKPIAEYAFNAYVYNLIEGLRDVFNESHDRRTEPSAEDR